MPLQKTLLNFFLQIKRQPLLLFRYRLGSGKASSPWPTNLETEGSPDWTRGRGGNWTRPINANYEATTQNGQSLVGTHFWTWRDAITRIVKRLLRVFFLFFVFSRILFVTDVFSFFILEGLITPRANRGAGQSIPLTLLFLVYKEHAT